MLNNSKNRFFTKDFAFAKSLALSQATLIFIHRAKRFLNKNIYDEKVEQVNRENAAAIAKENKLDDQVAVKFIANCQEVAKAIQGFWVEKEREDNYDYQFSCVEKQLLEALQSSIPALKQAVSSRGVGNLLNATIATEMLKLMRKEREDLSRLIIKAISMDAVDPKLADPILVKNHLIKMLQTVHKGFDQKMISDELLTHWAHSLCQFSQIKNVQSLPANIETQDLFSFNILHPVYN